MTPVVIQELFPRECFIRFHIPSNNIANDMAEIKIIRRTLGFLFAALQVSFWPLRSLCRAVKGLWNASTAKTYRHWSPSSMDTSEMTGDAAQLDVCHDRAVALLEQYHDTHQLEALQAGIDISCYAAQLTPSLERHTRRTEILRTYHSMLLEQFEVSNSPTHMVDALMILNRSLDFLPSDDPYAVEVVNLMIKISNASLLARKQEELSSDDVSERNLKRSRVLYLVSDMYFMRFDRMGNVGDLTEGCTVMRMALDHAPEGAEELLFWCGKLAFYLLKAYGQSYNLELLKESIRLCEQGVAIAPDGGDEDKAAICDTYANGLQIQAKRGYNTEGLDLSIKLSLDAVAATSLPRSKVAFLNNLGNRLEDRFDRIERLNDLREAIRVTRSALEYNPEGILLNGTKHNIGVKLLKIPTRHRSAKDFEEGITLLTEAVNSTQILDEVPPMWLNSLSAAYHSRYGQKKNLEDLETAIWYQEQALRLLPQQSLERPGYAVNMANLLRARATQTRVRTDVESALSFAQVAASSIPEDHVHRAGIMFILARLYILYHTFEFGGMFEMTVDGGRWTPTWEDKAIEIYSTSLDDQLGNATIRMVAAAQLMSIFEQRHQYSHGVKVGLQALDILHKTNTRLLSRDGQQRITAEFSDIAVETCALSIRSGGSAAETLELLELGRGSILGLLIEDRSDLSAVAALYPKQAARFEELRNKISQPGRTGEDVPSRLDSSTRRDRHVRELDQMILEIRGLPGQERFLKGPSAEHMQMYASGGHIVVINVADRRSDAIVVFSSHSQVIHLPDLTKQKVREWIERDPFRCEKRSERGPKNRLCHDFLKWLWRACVRPVLSALNLLNKSTDTELPRIWWIGTGLASSLPFHAAGDHLSGAEEDAFAYIISSYIPTIRALGYAQQRASKSRKDTVQLLVVLMPTTPDSDGTPIAALPNATEELAVVTAATAATHLVRSLDRPSCQDVLTNLTSCDIAHFVCHGESNVLDPSKSCLILQKHAEQQPLLWPIADKLTVQRVAQAHLDCSRIAYLSACSTAESRAEQLADEVIHIASGFQVAGFPHVIGSLWPTDDLVSVTVAEAFYRHVSAQHPASDRDIASALRNAVLGVRSRHLRQPLVWAQYIHIGA
jgi:tetratricopeptide (TPR) repeat protein